MEERFEKHRDFLVDRIDPDFGLLDKLRANRILTREAVHKIKLKDNTTEDKNRILLDFILTNKKANELVLALRDSGQTHLVNYLNADGGYRSTFGDDWPLSESDISHLEINCEGLVDLLDTSDLCIRLFSEKVLNDRQKQLIFSKPTNAEKNEALLDILTKCSLRQYNKTIACLKDSNQSHIAKLLSEGGVVVRVHANLEGAVGNVDELEEDIITQLTKVLENRPFEEHHRLLDLTQQRIIAAKKGQSIVIYIHCTTNDELQQLIDLLKTDELKEIIERVFNEMFSFEDVLKVTLTWSLEEFKRVATYFDSDDVSLNGDLQSKLTVTEKIFGKNCGRDATTQTDEDLLERRITDSNEDCLDLKEKLQQELKLNERLIKLLKFHQRQIGFLLEEVRNLKHKLEEAKEMFCKDPCDVQDEEFQELHYIDQYERRKQKQLEPFSSRSDYCFYLKRKLEQTQKENDKLKKLLEHQTHIGELPEKYKSDPILVQTIRITAAEEKQKSIYGLAILDKELFVVFWERSEVEVYDSIKFSFIRRWNLQELINPWDIVSCKRNKCLYIIDFKVTDWSNKIFRADPKGKLIKKWSTGGDYGYTLSVTDESNVIVAVYYKHKINEYSPDGQLIRDIKLSSDVGIRYPWHATKLTNGSFVVSLGYPGDDLHTVIVVDGDGKLKKSFCEKCRSFIGQMTGPLYLLVDGNGFVMVADRYNSRVLLLDSDLEFKREILSKEKHGLRNPTKILLDDSSGRLFLADNKWKNQRILIFQFK